MINITMINPYPSNIITYNITNTTNIFQALSYTLVLPFIPYLIVLLVFGLVLVSTKKPQISLFVSLVASVLLTNFYRSLFAFDITMLIAVFIVFGIEYFTNNKHKSE